MSEDINDAYTEYIYTDEDLADLEYDYQIHRPWTAEEYAEAATADARQLLWLDPPIGKGWLRLDIPQPGQMVGRPGGFFEQPPTPPEAVQLLADLLLTGAVSVVTEFGPPPVRRPWPIRTFEDEPTTSAPAGANIEGDQA